MAVPLPIAVTVPELLTAATAASLVREGDPGGQGRPRAVAVGPGDGELGGAPHCQPDRAGGDHHRGEGRRRRPASGREEEAGHDCQGHQQGLPSGRHFLPPDAVRASARGASGPTDAPRSLPGLCSMTELSIWWVVPCQVPPSLPGTWRRFRGSPNEWSLDRGRAGRAVRLYRQGFLQGRLRGLRRSLRDDGGRQPQLRRVRERLRDRDRLRGRGVRRLLRGGPGGLRRRLRRSPDQHDLVRRQRRLHRFECGHLLRFLADLPGRSLHLPHLRARSPAAAPASIP